MGHNFFDTAFMVFVLFCATSMAAGFTAIIVLAGEIVNRDTFKGDDNDR